MCGIVGIIAKNEQASTHILAGLKRLEYRGYDSAGIATLHDGAIHRRRAEGKIINLEQLLGNDPLTGHSGIGHTRWATHGMPSEANAHPHATDKVAVVHNGIIDNYQTLRSELEQKGYEFHSQTDSEVVPILLTSMLEDGLTHHDAVLSLTSKLHGAYALGILFKDLPGELFVVRQGAPLAIGSGEDMAVIGSDALALSGLASTIQYLEDGDSAHLTLESATIWDEAGKEVTRANHPLSYSPASVGKGNYRHFMEKEIFEQPSAVADTISSYYNPATQEISLPLEGLDLTNISRIQLVACGTSYYASLAASYWIEQIARVPCQVDIASEFRYRDPILDENGLSIVISQSGETADTLAALKYINQHQKSIAIVNVPMSSIAREANHVIYTHAGPEIGVASTKAFTTQLAALACFALTLAKTRGHISNDQCLDYIHDLLAIPSLMSDVLHDDGTYERISHALSEVRDVLYLGRGTSYAIAHEGALKLKELSYIHAEAYAAGEMKHGPIALIDEHVPIIALAPSDSLFEKTVGNLQEANARGGQIISFTDAEGAKALKPISQHCITLPDTGPFVAPILYSLPVQMLAYHTAVHKGTDVDQPRNLAKSVTVE